MIDTAILVARLREGKTDVFAEIIEEYQYPLIRYLSRLTGDDDLAQDLAQDTFLQAYKNILKTDTELNLKAWLYRIATNNALQYHRRKKIISLIPFEIMRKPEPHHFGSHTQDLTEKIAVSDVLIQIPYEKRICLVLHYVEGFRYREIAETLGISEEAVRKRVSRGKQIFKRLYDEGEKK
jgi:RNA polymerase sigma-70 factor (ECF subfamily)